MVAGLSISDAELERRVARLPVVREAVADVAREVAVEARDRCRLSAYDTGRLLAAIRVVPGDGPERLVRSDPGDGEPERLPRWINDGTGLYGPRRTPIVPRKAPFLVFRVEPKGSAGPGDLVFARSVRGRPATPFMREAGASVGGRRGLRWVPSR